MVSNSAAHIFHYASNPYALILPTLYHIPIGDIRKSCSIWQQAVLFSENHRIYRQEGKVYRIILQKFIGFADKRQVLPTKCCVGRYDAPTPLVIGLVAIMKISGFSRTFCILRLNSSIFFLCIAQVGIYRLPDRTSNV